MCASLELEHFVAYKARYGLVRDAADVERHLSGFEAWCGTHACDGQDDPRILPLHVFETDKPWLTLADAGTARAFGSRYGPPSSRRDDGGKCWDRALARHGGPQLAVAGCPLPVGTHWDVRIAEQRTSVATICTADGVWEMRGPGAYVNVYPDSGLRKTKRASGVRKVWPR